MHLLFFALRKGGGAQGRNFRKSSAGCDSSGRKLLGHAAGFVVQACLAVSNVIFKRKLAHCENLQFTIWQMVMGAAG